MTIIAAAGDEAKAPGSLSANSPAEVRRAVLWRFADGIGLELFSFAFFVVLSRLLLPDTFGIVSVAATIIQGCRVVLMDGFSPALLQKAELESEHLTAAFWANVGLGSVCALAVSAIALPLSISQGKAELLPVLISLSPVLVLSGAAWIFQANLKRHLRYDISALSTLVSIIIGGTVGVVLAHCGAGVWSLVGQQLCAAVAALVILFVGSPWHPGVNVSFRHLSELAAFARKSSASSILDFLSRRLDALVLGFFFSASAIGIYFVAARLAGTVMITILYVGYDLVMALLPRFPQKTPAFREASYRALQLTLLFSLSAFIGMALIAGSLVPLMFGSIWSGSVRPLQILCLSSIAYTFILIGRQILNAAGHAGSSLVIAAVNAAFYIVALLLAAPRGLVATAAAGGVASCLCVPIVALILRWKLGLRIRRMLSDQVPIWGAALLMTASVSLFAETISTGTTGAGILAVLLAKVALGFVVFVSAVWLLAPSVFRDLIGWTERRVSKESRT